THALHRAECEGHSVLPLAMVAQRGREMALEPPCPLDTDLLQALQDELEDRLIFHKFADGTPACQLIERADICTNIRNLFRRARRGQRLSLSAKWRALLDAQLGEGTDDEDKRARVE